MVVLHKYKIRPRKPMSKRDYATIFNSQRPNSRNRFLVNKTVTKIGVQDQIRGK